MRKAEIRLMEPTSDLAGAYHSKVVREYEVHKKKPKPIKETRTEEEVARDLAIGKRNDGTFKRGLGWLK